MAWTLSFELFFYGLLALGLLLPRPRWRWALVAAPSLLALLMAASGRPVGFGQAQSVTSLLTSPYQVEFLLGCGVAVLAARPPAWLVPLRQNSLLQAALASAAAILLLTPFPATWLYRSLLLLVLAVLILFSAVRDWQRLPGLRALAWVGGLSYSLYLLHNPIQSLVIRLAIRLALPELSAALLLVLVPLLAAVVYFRGVEAWSLRLMQRAASHLQAR